VPVWLNAELKEAQWKKLNSIPKGWSEPPSVITKRKFQEQRSASSEKEQHSDYGPDILLQKRLLNCLTKETQQWEHYTHTELQLKWPKPQRSNLFGDAKKKIGQNCLLRFACQLLMTTCQNNFKAFITKALQSSLISEAWVQLERIFVQDCIDDKGGYTIPNPLIRCCSSKYFWQVSFWVLLVMIMACMGELGYLKLQNLISKGQGGFFGLKFVHSHAKPKKKLNFMHFLPSVLPWPPP